MHVLISLHSHDVHRMLQNVPELVDVLPVWILEEHFDAISRQVKVGCNNYHYIRSIQ